MLTVQKVPRLPKPVKTGSITDSEREEVDRSKAEEAQTELDPAASLEMGAPKDESNLQKESTSGPSASLEADAAQSADIVVPGLSEDMTTILIRACVSMISVPVDPDTLHATLRLCLRLTRNHHYAMMFAELKSTRMILGLTQTSGFNGFAPLVTLLFRHIIEDPATLRHTMEKVSPNWNFLAHFPFTQYSVYWWMSWTWFMDLFGRWWDQLWLVEQEARPQEWCQAALVPEKSITSSVSLAPLPAGTLNALLKLPATVSA